MFEWRLLGTSKIQAEDMSRGQVAGRQKAGQRGPWSQAGKGGWKERRVEVSRGDGEPRGGF